MSSQQGRNARGQAGQRSICSVAQVNTVGMRQAEMEPQAPGQGVSAWNHRVVGVG